jgi:hypothetical protein
VEEVFDFLEIMLRDVGDVEVFAVIRVVARDAQDLVVEFAAVEHAEDANGPRVDLATGERRLVEEHEHVARVVIFGERARNEAVVARVVHRRKEHTIEAEESRRFVQLVLVLAAARDLDHRRDLVRRVRSGRQVVPGVDHDAAGWGSVDGSRCIVPL